MSLRYREDRQRHVACGEAEPAHRQHAWCEQCAQQVAVQRGAQVVGRGGRRCGMWQEGVVIRTEEMAPANWYTTQ